MDPTTPHTTPPTGASPAPRATRRAVAVLLTVLVALGLFASPAAAQESRPSDPSGAESQFLTLLNQERAKAGLGPLQLHPNLVRDARVWSRVMADQDRLFHTSTLADDTARSVAGWTRAGENVGRGWSIGRLHDAFVASPGHYRNIVGDFNYVGIGVVYTGSRTWVTFRFAKAAPAQVAGASVQSAPTAVMSVSQATGMVRRLYLAYFRREPETSGLSYWVNRLRSGSASLAHVSADFSASSEFRNTYGSLSNTEFVRLVYRNVLGRDPDAGGYSYWTRRMANGLGRGELMTEFSESPEFKRKTS